MVFGGVAQMISGHSGTMSAVAWHRSRACRRLICMVGPSRYGRICFFGDNAGIDLSAADIKYCFSTVLRLRMLGRRSSTLLSSGCGFLLFLVFCSQCLVEAGYYSIVDVSYPIYINSYCCRGAGYEVLWPCSEFCQDRIVGVFRSVWACR